MSNSTSEQIIYGGFVPKRSLAYVGLICYGIVSLAFLTFLVTRPPRYMLVIAIGSTSMALGFAFREIFIGDPYSEGKFIIQDLLILLSPCFFLAGDYMILSRLAVSLTTPSTPVSEKCLMIPATRISKIFVWGDVATFLIQAIGGSMTTQAAHANLGKKIALIGLILQLVSFGLFTCLLIAFGLRVRKLFPEVWALSSRTGGKDWRILLVVTGITCIGILVRSAFRILEFSQGGTGYITMHEAFFYLFDSLPLFLAISLYVFVWPPAYTHPKGMEKLDGMETYPMRAPGAFASTASFSGV
ncbi:hypothetical protein FIBSPDRAFT_1048403 [Athelia psychrophila]|uniref:RTA1-domain-containing protein n=1 Tax=Athelia psychrophila TaxID=1759441 RepID=A0A166DSU4_9AGAM|nr:hypothetical protein FIBSPDRAFT_1048403 [Fibularhizoctonia sp. CBS 109695]